MPVAASNTVEGYVGRGFEAVRDAFADNFARRRELGGACCVYHRGEKVVDLWGGIRNKRSGEPWEQDTMVIVYSATIGLDQSPFEHIPGTHREPGHRVSPRSAACLRAQSRSAVRRRRRDRAGDRARL